VVIRATEALEAVGATLIGAVINHVTAETGSDYFGYGYGYQYEGTETDAETAEPLDQAA
jgi:hypothetical protein